MIERKTQKKIEVEQKFASKGFVLQILNIKKLKSKNSQNNADQNKSKNNDKVRLILSDGYFKVNGIIHEYMLEKIVR